MIKYFQIFFVSIMLISCSYNNEVVSMNEVNGTWDKKKELLFTMKIDGKTEYIYAGEKFKEIVLERYWKN